MPVGVAIIEDDPTQRRILAAQISLSPALCLVGSFSTYDLAAPELERLAPDVVLLDLNLPGTPGLRAAKLIEANCPRAKVLILSGSDDRNTILDALAAGAEGYMLKSEPAERLAHGIWRIHKGHAVLSEAICNTLVKSLQGRRPLLVPLTDLETEVARRYGKGDGYKQIETDLLMSKTAVKKCMARIRLKSLATTTSQAIFRQAGKWD